LKVNTNETSLSHAFVSQNAKDYPTVWRSAFFVDSALKIQWHVVKFSSAILPTGMFLFEL